MPVQPISSLSPTEPNLYTAKRNDEMDKTDFLRLLITQLQHQDPLNPQDPAEFTAQLTQFGNLEQLISLNDAVQDLQILQLSGNNTQAAALIGKNVLYEGGTVQVSGGAPGTLNISAPSGAADATLTISNSAGRIIRTIRLGGLSEGIQQAAWDGLDESGNPVMDGTYSFSAVAADESGNSLTVTALSEGRVRGVSFQNGAVLADVGNRLINLNALYSIRESASV